MKKMLIYNDQLLPYSQTFILEQAKALKRYRLSFIGNRSVKGISLKGYNSFCINPGDRKWIEYLFKLIRKNDDLEQFIQKVTPELIHAHFGICGSLIYPTAVRNNLPLICTYHGYDITVNHKYVTWKDPSHKLYTYRENELKKSDAYFIAVSKFIENKLIKNGFDPNHVFQHYIGVDFNRYNSFMNLDQRRSNRIVFTGRLVEKKGLNFLYESLYKIQDKLPKTELVIIGDGPMRSFIEKFKNISNLIVEYKSVLKHNEVLKEINKASVFCVPSVTASNGDSEAFGMVFAEAMSLGVPVVSFAHGGIPEVVKHEETGLLATEKDTSQLGKYLLEVITNQDFAHKLGQTGIQRVKNKFNIEKQTTYLEKIYEKIT